MASTAPPAYQALPNGTGSEETAEQQEPPSTAATQSAQTVHIMPQPVATDDAIGAGSAPVHYVTAQQPPQIGASGFQFPVMAVSVQPAPYEGPHDFLVASFVTAIVCGIFNIFSITFGIPAIILSVLSLNHKNNKNYPQAKTYGKYAFFMTVWNIFFTLMVGLVTIGIVVGCTRGAS